MSAGSAQEQIPTRTRWVRLGDLLVDARRDDAVDVDRLRDVLEGLLPEALEDEVVAHALGRRRAHDDLPTLRRPGEARGDVRRGARRREGPPLRRAHAELGGAHERLAGVDAMWSWMGGKTPPYSSLRRAVPWWIANAARVAFSAWSVPPRSDWKMTMRPSPAVSFTSPW